MNINFSYNYTQIINSNIFFSLKVLKLYAWEMEFGKKILDIRENESKYTTKDRTAGMLMHFSWMLAPFAVCFHLISTVGCALQK